MLKKSKQKLSQKRDPWRTFTNPFEAQASILKGMQVKTIFDVGANAGQTSEAYRAYFPDAAIYSFEPFPESFQKVKKRHEADSMVKPFQLALSNQPGLSTFHVNQCSANHSLLSLSPDSQLWAPSDLFQPVSTIQVSTTTLDSFCEQQGISHLDILKIDAQGAELLILEGGVKVLKNRGISLIFVEVNFVPLYEGQADFCDLHSYLNQHGYRLFDFFHGRYSDSGQLKWADAIFVGLGPVPA